MEARETGMRVLLQAAAGDDPSRRIGLAKDLLAKTGASAASDREQLAIQLRMMASLLRDVELMASGADRAMLTNTDVESALARLTPFHGERGLKAFHALDRGLAALDRNASAKIVADWVALRL